MYVLHKVACDFYFMHNKDVATQLCTKEVMKYEYGNQRKSTEQ